MHNPASPVQTVLSTVSSHPPAELRPQRTKLPKVLSLDPKYQELKELDELLDSEQDTLAEAQQLYQKTLRQFATLCHQLWQQEKAQGSRQGKGFRSQLQNAGIKVGRAYRAMKKFFPADFPAKRVAQTPSAVSGTSSAADEVAPTVRFTGKLLPSADNTDEAREVLECTFAYTPEEKAEFLRCLKVVGAPQVQRLLLEAMRQAAKAMHTAQAQKKNKGNNNDKGRGQGPGDVKASESPLKSEWTARRRERMGIRPLLKVRGLPLRFLSGPPALKARS